MFDSFSGDANDGWSPQYHICALLSQDRYDFDTIAFLDGQRIASNLMRIRQRVSSCSRAGDHHHLVTVPQFMCAHVDSKGTRNLPNLSASSLEIHARSPADIRSLLQRTA